MVTPTDLNALLGQTCSTKESMSNQSFMSLATQADVSEV